mgnify:CR=1 FL=1
MLFIYFVLSDISQKKFTTNLACFKKDILNFFKTLEEFVESNKDLIKIEVEVSTLEEVKDAIAAKSDIIMLDNMNYSFYLFL